MATKIKASDIIALAKNEVGYIGKKSNAQLDDKTANITGKYTKYARDLYNAGYYGGKNKNGYDWCCVFIDWLFYNAAGNMTDAMEIKPTNDYGAGVGWAYKAFSEKGMTAQSPLPGDQVFYAKNGSFTHTGLVAAVDAENIYTIEGNWSNSVAERTIPLGSPLIYGYGRPNYAPEEPEDPNDPDEEEFYIGDEVGLKDTAMRYCSGYAIPQWVKDTIPLYVRNVNGAKITISIFESGDITGTVWVEDLYHLDDGGNGGDDDEPDDDVVKIPREDYNKLKEMAEALVDQAHDLLDKINDFS